MSVFKGFFRRGGGILNGLKKGRGGGEGCKD